MTIGSLAIDDGNAVSPVLWCLVWSWTRVRFIIYVVTHPVLFLVALVTVKCAIDQIQPSLKFLGERQAGVALRVNFVKAPANFPQRTCDHSFAPFVTGHVDLGHLRKVKLELDM